MTYLPDRNFLIEVAKGSVPGFGIVHKFGRNPTVPNGSWEHISLLSAVTSFLSAPTTVRIKAGGNAADTAAGAGARGIHVIGIDDNLVEVSETIVTAGASASANSTASFWRLYRAHVSTVGTYGVANTGDVVVENSGGGTDLIDILAEHGQSEYGGYTIPTGKTGYLFSIVVNVDAAKNADVRLFSRANFNDTVAPMSPYRIQLFWDAVLGFRVFTPRGPLVFPALTDLWFEARGGGAGTEVSVDFKLLLVDD